MSQAPHDLGDTSDVASSTRKRPDELTYPAPDWWIRLLNLKHKQVGWTKRKLAAEAGIGYSSLSRLMKGEYAESRDVAPLCRTLGLPYPVIEAPLEVQSVVTDAKELLLLDSDQLDRIRRELREALEIARKARKR